jgi:hypothetical protein
VHSSRPCITRFFDCTRQHKTARSQYLPFNTRACCWHQWLAIPETAQLALKALHCWCVSLHPGDICNTVVWQLSGWGCCYAWGPDMPVTCTHLDTLERLVLSTGLLLDPHSSASLPGLCPASYRTLSAPRKPLQLHTSKALCVWCGGVGGWLSVGQCTCVPLRNRCVRA